MTVNREDKEQAVAELRDALQPAQAIIVAEYRGVRVGDIVQLRRKLRQAGVHYRVAKNTLARLAIRDTDKQFLSNLLVGPTALAWSKDDPVAAAKILTDFAKDKPGLVLKGGYLTGKSLNPAGVKALSELPGKDELRGKFLSVLNAPAQKMVTVLSQVQRNFMSVLKQQGEKLEGNG
jgi:large subunit ribosomal protein L10